MFKRVFLFSTLLFCFNLLAAQNVVQGPFALEGVREISIELIQNNDKSITLRKTRGGNRNVIDNYEVGDGTPKIESVFFHSINNQKNIIILVSWNEININAVHYKVYAYRYNEAGSIYINNDIKNDKALEGYDGYSGSGATFDYKDVLSIKKYLTDTYNKNRS